MSVEERVNEIFTDLLDVKAHELVPAARLREDLQTSSVDMVEIIAALENEFGIDISDQEAAEVKTMKELYDFVKAKSG